MNLKLLAITALAASSAVAQTTSSLASTFVGGLVISNSPPPAAATQLFDLQVTNPAGIVVSRIDVNVNTAVGTLGNVDVYLTGIGGTHVGNQLNAAAWTLASANSVASAQGRTQVLMQSPFTLAPGNYGIALHFVGLNPVYTNPNTPVPPLPPTYSNADLTLDMSAARVRASDPTNAFGATGAGFSPRQPNVEVFYSIGAATVDFTGTPTRGASPLAVQFTGIGTSGNPGGILAWAWDFDNDGVVDSTLQSPLHTYTQCGDYTVTLNMVDALGTYTVTKQNYIQTDVIVPDFTVQMVSPNVLQFTDTSSPAPQTYAWDLNGDGITDSTLANPLFTYANACSEVDVSLTVSRACRAPLTLNRRIAVAQNLSTRFDGPTFTVAGATGGINYFDMTVNNPQGLTVCSMHVHSQVAAGSPVTVNVHLRPGTYVGNTASQDGWTLVASATANSRGGGQRTFLQFSPGLYLPAGTYGVAMEMVGGSPRYNNIGQTATFSNADLSITAGATQAEPVFSTGTLFSPRIWNGAFYYSTCTLSGEAGYGFFGPGCAGALGTPTNVATSQPRLGNTLGVAVGNAPANAGFMVLGLSNTSSLYGPLPIDLGVVGAPGCPGRVSDDVKTLLVSPGTTLNFALAIPNNPGLLCVRFYTQCFVLDPAANGLGIITSDAAAAIVGN